MARQNIDEEWKTDPRRDLLIEKLKDSRLADGARVQLNWLVLDHKGQPIPLKKFKFVKDFDTYIECGLAEIRGDLVHIAGADRYREFFDKQKQNSAKGGAAMKAKASPKKPKHSPKSPSSSFSLSSSFSPSGSSLIPSESVKTSDFIAGYCRRFKDRWNVNPPIKGKESGIAKRLAEGWSTERMDLYLDAFFAMPDAGLVKAKHPLGLFEFKLNEVVTFAESGVFTTQREAHNADNTAANAILLKKVQNGEIK